MRKKLMLEALAAWLALAAASGQANASIQTGANSVSTMVTNPEASLDEVTTPYSDGKVPANGSIRANADVALLTSAVAARKEIRTRLTARVHAPARADLLTPGRENGGTELKRAVFNQHEVVGASRGVLVVANGNSGQVNAIQAARNADLDAEKFYLIANAKLAPEPKVAIPEPGNWATVLAGLLGVIAIARRRMSL